MAVVLLGALIDAAYAGDDGVDLHRPSTLVAVLPAYVLLLVLPALPLVGCLVDRRWCWALLLGLGFLALLPSLILLTAGRVDWVLASVLMLVLGTRNVRSRRWRSATTG